jgi:hypothetical protein
MAINKLQNYTIFMGKGVEFYQWEGNAPYAPSVMNSGLKKWDQIGAIFVPLTKHYRIIISFSTA